MLALHYCHWMTRRDLPAALDVALASFVNPWGEEDFLRALNRKNCISFVVELGARVVAFAVYELHPDRIELLNFAVHPAHRRAGVGTTLIEKLKYKTVTHRRPRLRVVVPESAVPAHLFFRSRGLRAVGVARDHFGDEGGYTFEYVPTAREREAHGCGDYPRAEVVE